MREPIVIKGYPLLIEKSAYDFIKAELERADIDIRVMRMEMHRYRDELERMRAELIDTQDDLQRETLKLAEAREHIRDMHKLDQERGRVIDNLTRQIDDLLIELATKVDLLMTGSDLMCSIGTVCFLSEPEQTWVAKVQSYLRGSK